MASRRDFIEAEDFQRRRGVAALQRADTLAVEDVPRRPNAMLIAGLVIVVLIAAGSAVTAFLTGRAPDGWLDDGSLVVDSDTGGRYLADAGALRPAPTMTAALLAGGRRQPVSVPHARVVTAPVGVPLPGDGTPEVPPALPDQPTALTACLTGADTVDVFGGRIVGDGLAATGMLVRTPGSPDVVLLDRQRGFRLDPAALVALGYSPDQVRDVPAGWLALVPAGPTLAPVGLPPDGQVVTAGSGREFVLDGGRARPVANTTSARLLPASTRTVGDAEIGAMPAGPPIGVLDGPSDPPRVPTAEEAAVPCVFGGGTPTSSIGYAGAVSDGPSTRPSPPHQVQASGSDLQVTWHLPPGQGGLYGPPTVNQPPPASDPGRADRGITLADGGIGYPVADTRTLQQLGYRRDQLAVLDAPWAALLAPGPVLAGR